MNKKDVINFLQDFGCATLEQLQILTDDKTNNFKYLLQSNIVSKKGNIFVHNNSSNIDNKMIVALDILCKYKPIYKNFFKGYSPVYISFLTKNDTLYNIIVTDMQNQIGVLKQLNKKPCPISEADKYILLFEDDSLFNDIIFDKPYLYCTYPNIKIIKKLP